MRGDGVLEQPGCEHMGRSEVLGPVGLNACAGAVTTAAALLFPRVVVGRVVAVAAAGLVWSVAESICCAFSRISFMSQVTFLCAFSRHCSIPRIRCESDR